MDMTVVSGSAIVPSQFMVAIISRIVVNVVSEAVFFAVYSDSRLEPLFVLLFKSLLSYRLLLFCSSVFLFIAIN